MAQFFTVKDTSLILGYSTNTVYKLLKEGRIKAARGTAEQGRFRISRTSLEDFLKVKLPEDPLAAMRYEPSQNTPIKKEFTESPYKPPKTVTIPQESLEASTFLSLGLTRALVIIGLLLILADIFLSRNFSLPEQGLRLFIMGILIILTYQSGSLSSQR